MQDYQYHGGNNVSKYGAENTCHVQSALKREVKKGQAPANFPKSFAWIKSNG
jgi:hypothetical protein